MGIDATKLQVEARLRSNEAIVLEELQPLYDKRDLREHPDIWIVRGEFSILTKLRETIEHAKEEILAAFPVIPEAAIDMLVPAVRAVGEKGIAIQVMATRRVPASSLEKLAGICDVHVREQMFGGGIIVDRREVMLLLGEDETERVVLAIWSDHLGLAKFAKNYFDSLWQQSRPLS